MKLTTTVTVNNLWSSVKPQEPIRTTTKTTDTLVKELIDSLAPSSHPVVDGLTTFTAGAIQGVFISDGADNTILNSAYLGTRLEAISGAAQGAIGHNQDLKDPFNLRPLVQLGIGTTVGATQNSVLGFVKGLAIGTARQLIPDSLPKKLAFALAGGFCSLGAHLATQQLKDL